MTLIVTLALGLCLLIVAIVDLRRLRIPDALSLPLVAAGLAWTAFARPEALLAHLAGALAGYAAFALFGELYFRRRGVEGLGLGDAKLLAAGGAWLGWQSLPAVVLIASVAGLVFALATRALRRDAPLAFGPWIALGIWLCWIAAA